MPKYATIALDLRLCSENARLITACNRNFEKLCFFNMLKLANFALALRLCSENARTTTTGNLNYEKLLFFLMPKSLSTYACAAKTPAGNHARTKVSIGVGHD